MLTGVSPFCGETPSDIIAAVLQSEPPRLSRDSRVPAVLDRVIMTCLAKNPDDRWQSAKDLARELKWITTGRDSTEAAPTVPQVQRWKWRWQMVAAALIAVIVIGAVVRALIRSGNPTATSAIPAADRRLSLLFSSDDEMSDPVLSADGKTVAFVALSQDRYDLFVSRAAGGGRIRVTDDLAT